jgi:two-component system, NarL family, response regulator YdfI
VTRVFIVARVFRARREMALLLDRAPDLQVVGTSASLDGVSEDWEELDVLVIRDTGDSSDDLLELLEETGLPREIPILLIFEQSTPSKMNRAIQLGVRGILPADAVTAQIISAVGAMAKGLMVFQPNESSFAAVSSQIGNGEAAELLEPLTPREREVLQMLASGLGNKQIAARLQISEHTAKFHVAAILGKLGASSRTEAVSLGLRCGLILL